MYTYQCLTESGSFSPPYGDDVSHARTLTDLRNALDWWVNEVSQYSDESAWLRVWHGKESDVTDIYPDFECYQGPRGGFHKGAV